jgi:tetratricopeptide (TPR) repeat protein
MVGILILLLCGCATPERKAAELQLRYAAARDLFEQTLKQYQLPSADLQGEKKVRMLDLATAGYGEVLKRYSDQKLWCSLALCNLGNARAAQGRLDEAIKLYNRVAEEYPQQDWEVLQAWKSAADLLWDAGRHDEALEFCRKIVGQFDSDEEPTPIRQIVQGAKSRLVSN